MLTDEQIEQVVVYLRSLAQDEGFASPAQAPEVETTAPEAVATVTPDTIAPPALEAEATFVPPAANIGEDATWPTPETTPFEVERAFVWACSGCHRIDARGNEPFGPGVADSDLLQAGNDDALIAFLVEGRPLVDPREAYPHPPRGGYPALTDEQIRELAACLRELLAAE